MHLTFDYSMQMNNFCEQKKKILRTVLSVVCLVVIWHHISPCTGLLKKVKYIPLIKSRALLSCFCMHYFFHRSFSWPSDLDHLGHLENVILCFHFSFTFRYKYEKFNYCNFEINLKKKKCNFVLNYEYRSVVFSNFREREWIL